MKEIDNRCFKISEKIHEIISEERAKIDNTNADEGTLLVTDVITALEVVKAQYIHANILEA